MNYEISDKKLLPSPSPRALPGRYKPAGKGEITVTVKRGLRSGTLLNGMSGKEHSKELEKFWG